MMPEQTDFSSDYFCAFPSISLICEMLVFYHVQCLCFSQPNELCFDTHPDNCPTHLFSLYPITPNYCFVYLTK